MTHSGPGTPPEQRPDREVPFLSRLLATGLFTGYLPWASGTVGTLLGVAVYLIPGVASSTILLPLTIAGFFAGVSTSWRVATVVGHRLTKTAEMAKDRFQHGEAEHPDPSIVVIDEVVGMWVSLLFLPPTLPAIVVAFIAFRAFDILKPPPAAQLEKIPGGWGIMLDDVVAGVYSNIATRLCLVAAAWLVPGIESFLPLR